MLRVSSFEINRLLDFLKEDFGSLARNFQVENLHLYRWQVHLLPISIIIVIKILQGRAKRTRKFAQVKRLLNPNDARMSVYSVCIIFLLQSLIISCK